MTDTLLVLPGPPAFSAFRLRSSLHPGARCCSGGDRAVCRIRSSALARTASLTTVERGVADALLEYGPRVGLAAARRRTALYGIAAAWNDFAMVQQSHRHLSDLRPGEGAPCRARHSLVRCGSTLATRNPWRALLHDRMTQSIVVRRGFRGVVCIASAAAARHRLRSRREGRAALVAANETLGLALATSRSTTWPTRTDELGRDPDRRRADDVRAGQLGTLPAQDLQCAVVDRRRRWRRTRCST